MFFFLILNLLILNIKKWMYLLNENVQLLNCTVKGSNWKIWWINMLGSLWLWPLTPYRAWKTNSCPVLVGNLQCSVPIPLSVRTLLLYLFPVWLGILLPPFAAVHLTIESFLYSRVLRYEQITEKHLTSRRTLSDQLKWYWFHFLWFISGAGNLN